MAEMGEQEHVEQDLEEGVEEEGVQEEYKEELLQQFQTEDGSTIVLSSEQIAQMQEGMAEQHYVEEIIGGEHGEEGHVHHHVEEGHHVHDPNAEEGMETQQIHLDADGNAQIVTSDGQMHDLITLHAVGLDAQGNLIPGGTEGEVVEEGMGEHVEIPMDHSGMEQMIGDDEVVEEVISSGTQEEENYLEGDNMGDGNDMSQQFLNVQEAIFNPQTGTLQPITSVQSTSAPSRPVKRPTPKPQQQQQQQQQVKYVISQPSADGSQSQQQIFLDANSLQGLIQSGTITLDGSGNKNLILAQSPSKKQTVTRSPAKILPAPVPVGDQLQHQQGQSGMKKILVMQGNSLTALSGLNQGGETKLIQTTSPGGTSHLQYVRVVNKNTGTPHKIPIAPATLKPKPVAPKPGLGQTIITLPAGATDLSSLQNSAPGLGNLLMLPNYVTVKNDQNQTVQIRTSDSLTASSSVLTDSNSLLGGLSQGLSGGQSLDSFRSLLEPNGMRPRKPCNCTKSQCLKLYCDCFANGEFCHLCNCTNCFNNLNHEEDRQKAIKLVLERNPGAFRPKIGKSSQTGEAHERRHNKGCNCRRSGCLKNYCECYEAKIFCSGICKCTGCKNCIENIPSGLPNGVGVEQHFAGAGTAHRQTLKDLAEAAEVRVQQQNQVKNKMRAQMQEVSPQNNLGIMVPPIVFRYPSGSISYEVVTSTVELLLAKAEAGEKQKLSEGEIERQILEEFSECLASVMDLGTSVDMVLRNDTDDSKLSRLNLKSDPL